MLTNIYIYIYNYKLTNNTIADMSYKCVSGAEFNANNTLPLYKFTNYDEIHYGYQYKDGLNKDTKEFNPSGRCSKGGLYFCDISSVFKWMRGHYWVREVEIPDDAKVYSEHGKYKADKIIVGPRKKISDFIIPIEHINNLNMYSDMCNIFDRIENTEDNYIELVKWLPAMLKYMDGDKQTENVCLEAVKNKWTTIKYIHKQTHDLCIKSIELSKGKAIQFIRKQTRELCLKAMSLDNSLEKYIYDDDIRKECVDKYGTSTVTYEHKHTQPKLLTRRVNAQFNPYAYTNYVPTSYGYNPYAMYHPFPYTSSPFTSHVKRYP